jgi:hypothetical protein
VNPCTVGNHGRREEPQVPFIPFAASVFLAVFGLIAAVTVAAPVWVYVPILLLPAVGAMIGIAVCLASRSGDAAVSRRRTILSLASGAVVFVLLAGAVWIVLASVAASGTS